MKRTVVYVVDSLGLSGKTRALTNLALNLDRSRYRGMVITFAPPEGMLPQQLEAGGIPVVHVATRDGLEAALLGRMVQVFRKVRPTLVHCFNPRPMLYGGLAAAAISRPTIGTLSAFACLSPDKPYAFLPQPLHTSSMRNRLRNRVLSRLIRRFTAVSECAGDSFCTVNAIPRDKLRVIGYGVDCDGVIDATEIARTRAALGIGEGEILIGSVGRLVEQKDYPTQLRALALIARRSPVRMLIAGGGPLSDSLRALAGRLGIADRVSWLGERRDIPILLRCLDAFVIASKFEPFGVSVLEAMAAGLPIISTNVNELPDILDRGRAGMLVPSGQPETLAQAMIDLSSSSELRTRLGTQARTHARSRYSLAGNVAAYLKLYDEVLTEEAR